jgi:hypothetical protein
MRSPSAAMQAPTDNLASSRIRRWHVALPYVWAVLVAGAVTAPWFWPGFLFGTDWPGPRNLAWPTELSSSAPLQALLALGSSTLSAQVTAKILVAGLLFVAALTAYRALPLGGFVPRAAASLVYVLNPFVYGRLHYGQLFLVAAYAILPWVAASTYRVVVAPGTRKALQLAAGFLVVGTLALHLELAVSVLLATGVVAGAIRQRLEPRYLTRLGGALVVSGGLTLVASTYWLIPYLTGRSHESKVIAGIGTGDFAAYSSVPDPSLGLIPNLLGLYGFWAEASRRFPSLKLFVPGWQLVLLGLLLLALLGTVFTLVSREKDLADLRWWVIALVAVGAIGLALDAGVADPHTAPLVRWLDAVFRPYRGMRDAGKWAALLAVVYTQLVPLGVVAVLRGVGRLRLGIARDWATAIASGLALAIPLYYGNGLLLGMHNQIQPSQYPPGWYAADRLLASDPNHGRALFLPWHLYLRLSFVHNVNSVVATPAPTFFSIPVVISADPEVAGIPPPGDPEQAEIARLVQFGGAGDWAPVLARRGIKYVLVAKEVDSERFAFFDKQAGFARVGDYTTIAVYRDLLTP